jgi:hypothetical protein
MKCMQLFTIYSYLESSADVWKVYTKIKYNTSLQKHYTLLNKKNGNTVSNSEDLFYKYVALKHDYIGQLHN